VFCSKQSFQELEATVTQNYTVRTESGFRTGLEGVARSRRIQILTLIETNTMLLFRLLKI
jgi:hypothetical protein